MYVLKFDGREARFSNEKFKNLLRFFDPGKVEEEDNEFYLDSDIWVKFCDHECQDSYYDGDCPLAVFCFEGGKVQKSPHFQPCFYFFSKILTSKQLKKMDITNDAITFIDGVKLETAKKYIQAIRDWIIENIKKVS